MKRRFSPSKAKVMAELSQRQVLEDVRVPPNRSADYNKYFCHYNNAVYMGGMSGYKKHGKGIMLHDDGSSVITEYLHDTITGHNILFRDNSVTSIVFSSPTQFQVSYKQGHYIITIPFIDQSYQSHGTGILVDYLNHKIYRLQFKKGQLVSKILHLDKQDNDDAFLRNTVTKIIGVKHQQAFGMTFQKPNKVHIKTQRNKTTIGYFDEDGDLNGLGFTFYSQNFKPNGEKPLYLKSIERGYYRQSQLEVFGDKIFSNGNKYIGQFERGQFQGYGILISPEEMKWVFGKFSNGQLSNIEDSNYKKYTESEYQVWTNNLTQLHRRHRERWIDLDIELPDQYYLYKQLKEALTREMTHIDPDRVEVIKEDSQRLSRIQSQFENQYPGSMQNSKVERQLDRHYRSRTPKGLIKIEDVRPQSGIKEPTSPINQFNIPSTRSKPGQQEYRMQDPFKIDLIKIPEPQSQERMTDSRDRAYLQPLLKQTPSVDIDLPPEDLPPYRPPQAYDYPSRDRYRYKYVDQEPLRTPYYSSQAYTRAILEESRKSREKLRRSIERQNQLLRRDLERNYPTPYYDPERYPDRYVGKITNKRHFNYDVEDRQRERFDLRYPTTSKYYPSYRRDLEQDERSRSPVSLYPTTMRSPPRQAEQPYPQPKKYRPISPRNQPSPNFVKNNYKYWS